MGLRESLGDVSADLAKILNQLKDIQKVQKEIDKGATAYSKAVGAVSGASGGGRSSNGTPTGRFSTPPPAPGSQLGGVTASASGGGSGSMAKYTAQYSDSGGGSGMPGWARAAALTGASAATFAYNATPGVEDAYVQQSLKYRASFLSPGGYNPNFYQSNKALFGNMQTDPYGMMTVANLFTMRGMGQGSINNELAMRETAVTSAIFGQDNITAGVATAQRTSGSFAGRMAQYGIFVSNAQGRNQGLGSLIDQIWRRAYGSATRKITVEELGISIQSGNLGSFLNREFGDSPELKEQIIQGLIQKAQANGARLDYRDLGPYGEGAKNMPGAPGTVSAMALSVANGNTPENNPGLTNMALQSSRGNAIDAMADNLLEGYRAPAYGAVKLNDLLTSVTRSGNEFVGFLVNLKGALQAINSIGEISPLMGLLSGGLGAGFKALFAGGGGVSSPVGTSTSDSIPAMLSRGEYVINARAAQQIGKDNLDALNSVGHSLGSGYASPAKAFAKGGSTTGGGISEVVALAKKFSHLPYSSSPVVPVDKDGNPTGWGCATSVAWLYEKGAGITLPSRSLSYDQWRGLSQTVSEASMQPGDLIFQRNNGPSRANDNPVNHVEMYLGPGQVFNGGVGIQKASSYPPVKNGVKRVTGGGNAIGSSTPIKEGSTATAERSTTTTPAGLLPVSSSLTASRPNTFSLGGFTGGAKGLSLGISAAFSWIGGSLFGTTQRGGITSAGIAQRESTDDTATTTGKSEAMAEPTGGVGSGSGPAWLYKYLVSKGLRGNTLHKAWVIGMRESGGNPKLQSKDKYGGSWTSAGSPHYDVGLYQINNRHLPTVQKRYGGDMRQMLDLEKNYDMTAYMSNNWNNLLAWALESDGQTFNWSMYNPVPSWAGASMANHRRLWGEYDKYNTQNYSEGAYRTHEGMAKLHEGEMVLPATVAEQFRQMMRSASGPGSGGQQIVNINLKIERASDEEAERFARRVKKLLDEDNWAAAVRSA